MPPIQEEVKGRVAIARPGEKMETEEEVVTEMVSVVDVGAAIEPEVQVSTNDGNNHKDHNSACRFTLSQCFSSYPRKMESKDKCNENVAKQRKRLVESKFTRYKINVDSSDESEIDFYERSASKKPKIIPSTKLPDSPKPLKSILKKRLKNPIPNNRSSIRDKKSLEKLNPLRVRFHERFTKETLHEKNSVRDECNDQHLIILDQDHIREPPPAIEQQLGAVENLERPFIRRSNEAAMQALRSVGNDIIIWMRLTRTTTKHAMIHLSPNFPVNIIGETAIRWAGINPDDSRDWALVESRKEPEPDIETMLDHASFRIHSLKNIYKISMYPNEKDDEHVFNANVNLVPRKGYVPHFAPERVQLGEDWLYDHLRHIDLQNKKIILQNDFYQMVKFNFERRLKRRDKNNYYKHRDS